MKQKAFAIVIVSCFFVLSSLSMFTFAEEKKPPDDLVIKLDGAKLPPIKFSHTIHVEKNKLECVTCHHKDVDAKQPETCTKRHPAVEGKGNAPIAKDTFRKLCQTCRKENSAEGIKTPTACNGCHKK
jgi:hypothetical protein